MNPMQSISSVFRQYIGFSGRAGRSESWWSILFQIIVAFILGVSAQVLYVIFVFATFLPALAVLVRRLHDTGRTAWWLLLAIVPFGSLVLLIFAVIAGERRENRYGPEPLISTADGAFESAGGFQGSQDSARSCTNCGAELDSAANYCRSCGKAV